MKNLYLLEKIKDYDIENIKDTDNSRIIALDYITHELLSKHGLVHETIDDYLEDLDRKKIFDFCFTLWTWYENIDCRDVRFHDVNLLSVIDRNEFHELLMELIPKIHVIKKVLLCESFATIFASFSICELLENNSITNVKLFGDHKEVSSLTFDDIIINYNIGPISIKKKIDREKFRKFKMSYEKIMGRLFSVTKDFSEKNKIILLEFNPEIYSGLLHEIKEKGLQPVLINFRRPAISSFNVIRILRQTKSLVILPENLIDRKQFIEIHGYKDHHLKKIEDILTNKMQALSGFFRYNEMRFEQILIKSFVKILDKRLEEYIIQILVAEKITQWNNVNHFITLNFSGETEQIFSASIKKQPIILLQHAFSNYTDSIAFMEVFDDFHLVKNGIAVYGEVVKRYLVNHRSIPEDKIIVCGSPKYDSFKPIAKKAKQKKTILVTLRPIISHMEGIRIELYDKYEYTINYIIKICHELDNIEVIFKLHPQQHPHNQILKQIIEKKNPNLKIFQHESIKELLINCDLHINIAPDNFDASSVILEAMILKRPTLNIQLQPKIFEFEFIKANAIKTIMYDSDIKTEIHKLITSTQQVELLLKNSAIFLREYLVNHGNSSRIFIQKMINM